MKRIYLILALTAVLAGCGSTTNLDEVPVVDQTGTSVLPSGAGGSGSAVGEGDVTRVDVGASSQDAANVGRARVIYFDYDSYVIKPEFQSVIELHARYLKADKGRRVAIEGHTDERGGREYNLALGQKRAEAVRSALGLLGVVDDQIEAVSFGKEKPAVQGGDEAALAQNRRAEIRYK
ncbi:MAG: peptidoglycan-associated lipoprotein Pal [Gammaproteobacteria bacterium]|uniref:peptidoglycan-associated lipoprotein Pal n=1 Tax=Rhodoferax sp. TaxID=50421 RepID=UPI0017F72543|nr:peptidoglycan-associated lipoprotein Pal [Rhodoferax sp.]MBU3899122.1 peptidoglycan-associated lipoprotein Pal [Gammaproteobacteria bacterium]MBA3057401.1 peptidoglycan-associated lipoprotein Pal [Rhodoferax sp.]MBU3996218.1 peptidoglycan-associated lipoprotein Pal [Gammaproteobacteria bacterium]MBU4018566.1 peptidoglycan-associated lipoprotein Pal [Gammaproteobacteria bacterium]MBU4080578.1 peptidoglycan-associated lipoprotein Pal [Gammaproteobacteria bacterium]